MRCSLFITTQLIFDLLGYCVKSIHLHR